MTVRRAKVEHLSEVMLEAMAAELRHDPASSSEVVSALLTATANTMKALVEDGQMTVEGAQTAAMQLLTFLPDDKRPS